MNAYVISSIHNVMRAAFNAPHHQLIYLNQTICAQHFHCVFTWTMSFKIRLLCFSCISFKFNLLSNAFGLQSVQSALESQWIYGMAKFRPQIHSICWIDWLRSRIAWVSTWHMAKRSTFQPNYYRCDCNQLSASWNFQTEFPILKRTHANLCDLFLVSDYCIVFNGARLTRVWIVGGCCSTWIPNWNQNKHLHSLIYNT